jgi:F420-dependent oxidoreductase-like protein
VPYDAPIGRTRELIEICRMVWRRDRLDYHGKYYELPLPAGQGTGLGKPLKLINHPVRERIPIVVAAIGPKNVALAAELAEGWQPIFYFPEKAGLSWAAALAEGNAKRDIATLGELDVIVSAPLAIGDDVTALRDLLRPNFALYVGGMGAREMNFHFDVFCRLGFEAEATKIQDLYLAGRKDEATAAVPREMVEAISLIGPREKIRDDLEVWRASRVTTMLVGAHDPTVMRLLAELVL